MVKNILIKSVSLSGILPMVVLSWPSHAYTISNVSDTTSNSGHIYQYATTEEPNIVGTIYPGESVDISDETSLFIAKGDGHSFVNVSNANYTLYDYHGLKNDVIDKNANGNNPVNREMNAISGLVENGMFSSFILMRNAPIDSSQTHLYLHNSSMVFNFFINDRPISGGIRMADTGSLLNAKLPYFND